MPFISSIRGNLSATGRGRGLALGLSKLNITGGTVTEAGGYRIHTFSQPQSGTNFSLTNYPSALTVEFLLVAGGGSGAAGNGTCGGGGAGGMVVVTSRSLTGATNYPVTVGAGGPAPAVAANLDGARGNNSSFNSITALGGGGGSGWGQPVGIAPGGSGGGGNGGPGFSGQFGTATQPGQNPGVPALTNYGNPGAGATWPSAGGGGGGGAGGPGSPSPSGAGGNGQPSSISGSPVIYAGGGGGGTEYNANGGAGGAPGPGGGGGGGGTNRNNVPNAAIAYAGTDGLGGGGGGGSYNTPITTPGGTGGGKGGNGIAIIRYLYP